mgnify:CR=1 FL=1
MQRVDRDNRDPFEALAECDDFEMRVKRDEPLGRHTSLRIGGPADYWIEVGTLDGLRAVARQAEAAGLPRYVVGLGSNVLFPDSGIRGVVVRLVGELAEWQIEEEDSESGRATVQVGAGMVNAHLVRGLLDASWVGAEFLRLIPGTFGGAVALNAGTKEAELASILEDADLLVRASNGWSVRRMTPDQLELSYRHSELPEGSIVVSGRIVVEAGDVAEARAAMQSDRQRRDRTQPYQLASVGSTFANPEGDYAGRLIDEVGLKGERIGGARISETHANFFINEDDASAEAFLRLMALARQRVRDAFDVELRPEVRFVGFDGRQRLEQYQRELC